MYANDNSEMTEYCWKRYHFVYARGRYAKVHLRIRTRGYDFGLISIKEMTQTQDFSALAEFASRVDPSESINIQSRV